MSPRARQRAQQSDILFRASADRGNARVAFKCAHDRVLREKLVAHRVCRRRESRGLLSFHCPHTELRSRRTGVACMCVSPEEIQRYRGSSPRYVSYLFAARVIRSSGESVDSFSVGRFESCERLDRIRLD